jgi:Rod binding domain-containing protein
MNVSALTSSGASPLGQIADLAHRSSLAESSVKSGKTPAEERKAVAGQFEAILLRQFLDQSIGSMMGGEGGKGGPGGGVYGFMLTDVFASKLSAGDGMGLAKMIEHQLTPRGTPIADLPVTKGSS